uniref:Nucleophosmin n=1 Tax=Oryctolagus cuniculus TaxID=9986 RepID=A0A5F9D7N6_RABIT
MEDLMDMDMSPLKLQNYLFGCELKTDKDYHHFKVDSDENEHQLSLRTVSLGAGAKDELHIVDAEAMNYEGSPIKVTLATLKMSVQPMISLGGFEITPLVVLLSISGKRCAPGGGSKVPQNKVKLAAEEDDEDDDEEEETEEKAPGKKSIQDTPAKNAQKSNQNGKDSKPSTPRSKGPSSVEDIKAKMQASKEKGGSLPKVEAKFINYVKNCFRMTDQEAIQDLWQWRKIL